MGVPRTSIEQWAVLAAVVDQGGFAQAVEKLHRSQSAVSYAVSRLQAALDVPLLAIQGRKAVLTPYGETLLKRARPLTRDLETLEALARSLKQGWEPQLNITADAAFPRARAAVPGASSRIILPTARRQESALCSRGIGGP